jgi:hypothetical protein
LAEPTPPKRPTQSGRPSSTDRPRNSTTQPVGNARASALRDAVAHAVETDREFKKKGSFTGGNGRAGRYALVAIAVAVTLYSWIGRPQFIWGAPPPVPSPELQSADLRMSMYFFAIKVERYRKQHGTYPASVREIGDSVAGLQYSLLDGNTYELRGTAANREVVLRSDTKGAEFLGNAKELIQTRRKR